MIRTKDFIDKMMDYEAAQFNDPELRDDLLLTTLKNGYSLGDLLGKLEEIKYQEQLINKLVYENNN
jgi:hypothetical protein